VRDALLRVHRELGGNGQRAALVLPDGVARLVLLDPPAGVKPAEFARFRLAQGLPFAAGEALVDGVPAAPGRFLAAAVRRSVVRGYEAAAAAAGLGQERVELWPLLALGSLLRRGEAVGTLLAVVLSDAAFSLAYLEAGRLELVRNRRRDTSAGEYSRLRDEILRTAALAGATVAPRVVVFGADSAELAAALRERRPEIVEGALRHRLNAWLARAGQLPRLRKLAWATGLAVPAGLMLALTRDAQPGERLVGASR
jgi:hypothetical protein